MKRVPLVSSALLSAGYDESSQQLEIEFRNGSVYRYYGVPAGVYQFLLRSPSKGGYVHRMIDGNYRHEDISKKAPEQNLVQALQASLESSREE